MEVIDKVVARTGRLLRRCSAKDAPLIVIEVVGTKYSR